MSDNKDIKVGSKVVLNSGLVGVIEHWDPLYEDAEGNVQGGNRFRLRYATAGVTHTHEDHISTNEFELVGKGDTVKAETLPAEGDIEETPHDNQKPGLGDQAIALEDTGPELMSTEGHANDSKPAEGERRAPAKKAVAKKTSGKRDEITTTQNFS